MLASILAGLVLAGQTGLVQPAAPTPGPHVPTVADPIRGLDLWRGAKVAMSAAQVKALFPAANPPVQSTILTGGEIDRLQLSGVDLDGRPAIAHFFFKDSGLVSVELTLDDLKPGIPARNVADVRRIATDLTGRYGASYDCGEKSAGNINAYECKWLKTPLSIRLWYMDVAGQAPLFYLAYRQADDPGYNL